MILLKNTQRTIAIDKKSIIDDATFILATLGYAEFDLGIWFTTNKTIRRYNKLYRHKDKATDILSFSHHPTLRAGEKIIPTTPDDYNVGDLIISAEYVYNQLSELKVSFKQRLRVLLVHGICHLLGYDHELDQDYKVMHKKEQSLLKQLEAYKPLTK
jgi:probable rRNA maturation factor